MREGEQEEESGLCVRLPGAEGDDLGGIVERGDQLRGEQVDEDPDQLSHCGGTCNSEQGSFSGALILSGSKVLAYEGGQSQGEAGDGQEAEALDLRIRAASRDSHLSELVNISLDEYIGNGYDGILKSRRKPVVQKLPEHILIYPYFPDRETVFVGASKQLDQAQAYADKLRDHSGKRGGADPEVESSDQHQVEYDVDHGRDDQIDQRMAAVSDRLQDANGEIIHHESQ